MSYPNTGLHAQRAARGSFALLFIALLPLTAIAETQLDPVIVTATREPQTLSRSTADVVVISADIVRNTSATSVEELIRREAGIQVT
jgi:vitamin B12 transporter